MEKYDKMLVISKFSKNKSNSLTDKELDTFLRPVHSSV